MINIKAVAVTCLAFALLANHAMAESLRLDIERGEIMAGQPDESGRLILYITSRSRSDFTSFTARHVDQMIDVLIGGEVVVSPVIRSPMHARMLPVPALQSEAESKQIIEKLVRGEIVLEVRSHKE